MNVSHLQTIRHKAIHKRASMVASEGDRIDAVAGSRQVRQNSAQGGLAIIAETERSSPRRLTPTKMTLCFGICRTPTSPRVVQKFTGVVNWLQDARSFIYVLNGDGLWVISQPMTGLPVQSDSYSAGG
jgi:hypothetical protein